MMRTILAPTDGSISSERAMAVAETVARAQSAEVVLARVIEPIPISLDPAGYATGYYYDEAMRMVEDDARHTLAVSAGILTDAGVRVRPELLRGNAASVLLDLEAKLRPDLVVMATHGRSGVARFALGSVADRMVRHGTAPVLLVRALAQAISPLERALVPLDGSALAGEALRLVHELAHRPLREIHLLRVIDQLGQRSCANSYIDQVAEELRSEGLIVRTDIRLDEPARAIERAAAAADFVVMTTHGRGGLDRFRHGSVADRVAQHAPTPVLLVRAGQAAARQGVETIAEAVLA
jgi:nucleotide-binding universal stress UspA family protein